MLVGVILTLAVVGQAVKYLDKPGQPTAPVAIGLIPGVSVTPPAEQSPRRTGLIRGTRELRFGGTLTLSGTAESGGGYIRVRGSWNSGPWQTFAVAAANGRPYHFTFQLNHRGTLRLRVVQPDGYVAVGTYRIT